MISNQKDNGEASKKQMFKSILGTITYVVKEGIACVAGSGGDQVYPFKHRG